MASPSGVGLPLFTWGVVTAALAAVAALQLSWGWWIAPAAWGAVPVTWWLLKGPDDSWGIAPPRPAVRSVIEIVICLVAVFVIAVWPAAWIPAGPLNSRTVIVMCLWAPTVEELFFRGQLQGALERRWGIPTAVLASAVLFGVSHAAVALSWIGLATIGPALLFGAMRARQGSLLPAIVLHSGANLALLLLSPATPPTP